MTFEPSKKLLDKHALAGQLFQDIAKHGVQPDPFEMLNLRVEMLVDFLISDQLARDDFENECLDKLIEMAKETLEDLNNPKITIPDTKPKLIVPN
jgi:hypothetical protein